MKLLKKKKKIVHSKKRVKGAANTGALFTIVIIFLAGAVAFTLIGGQLPTTKSQKTGTVVNITPPVVENGKNNLQLYTFFGSPVTPTPAKVGCEGIHDFNTEDMILIGSDPGPGGTANAGGDIRVWVTDEGAPYIAPNAVVDPATGTVTNPGDTTALDTDTDGEGNYLWAPTLYIAAPGSPACKANAAGCTPHFPNIIKGEFSNTPASFRNGGRGTVTKGPAIDDFKGFENGPVYGGGLGGTRNVNLNDYTAEYIWNVDSLGLQAGNYQAQFVIHDGDRNLAIVCLTLKI